MSRVFTFGRDLRLSPSVPIHWMMAISVLAVVVGAVFTARYVGTSLKPLVTDAAVALRASERTRQSVEHLTKQAIPLIRHLGEVELLALRFVTEFDLLSMDPDRDIVHLKTRTAEFLAAADLLRERAGAILDRSSQVAFDEIVGVLADIGEEAEQATSPNDLNQLARDSRDILVDLDDVLAKTRETLEAFTREVGQDAMRGTEGNRTVVEHQSGVLSDFSATVQSSLGGLLLVVLVAMALLHWSLTIRLRQVRDYARRVASGQYDATVSVATRDRLGEVTLEVHRMACSLADLVQESEAQAAEARRARMETERQSWLNEALRELSEATRGELNVDLLTASALAVMADKTGAVAGILYCASDDALRPTASYAMEAPPTSEFPLGAGLAGQVALERKPKLLEIIGQSRLTAGPGLLRGAPDVVYLLPVLLNGKLKGVLEIGLTAQPAEDTARFLGLACDHLAICLHAAEQRSATDQALADVQQKSSLLEARGQELRLAVEAAEKASQAKSEFLARMSHEIRTPLNGVLGMVEILLKAQLRDRERGFVQTIQRSGEALLAVISDILDFSKIEAGHFELDLGVFDLRDLIEELGEVFAEAAHRKGLELVCRFPPEGPSRFQGDAARLRQILTNLVGNALKFTDEGEVVLSVDGIQTESDAAEVLISVRDTGIGIAEEQQARVFESFAQADGSSTRVHGGTGLGLAISLQLARLMGGGIEVESAPGHGSTFRLKVQVGVVDADVALDRARSLEGATVLVVDDNEANRQVLLYQLGEWGARCRCAGDAEEALRVLRTAQNSADPVGIAILDMHMPGMDGLELARTIRADSRLSTCRLMMLSSVCDTLDSQALRALDIGFHLTKPVRQAELLDCVVAMREPAQRPPGYAGDGETNVDRATPEEEPLLTGRVLLAEDHPVNQDAALEMLGLMGLEVDVVETGREAVRAWSEGSYDVVLMDWQMPEMDGTEAAREIRRREADVRTPVRTPIIAVTANALSGDREECLEAGMDDYVCKPYRWEEIHGALARFLPVAPAATPSSPTDAPSAPLPERADESVGDGGDLDGVDLTGCTFVEVEADSPLDATVLAEVRAMDERGKGGFMARLFDNYRQRAAEDMEVLRAAMTNGDTEALRRTAHRLKSASRNVGGVHFAELCQQLESCGQENRMDEVGELMKSIEAEHGRVDKALAAARREVA